MTFDEILAQVGELLQREGRVSYRVLKRRFNLDDEYLEDLKAELIQAKRLAIDEDGAGRGVWDRRPERRRAAHTNRGTGYGGQEEETCL